MEINKEEVRIAMDSIGRMGAWDDTPQGHEYWRKVYMELKHLFSGTEQPKPQPQYRAPNEGDMGKQIEVRQNSKTAWSKRKLLCICKGKYVCESESIPGQYWMWELGQIAIDPEQPPAPEPEWVTPTDEDAKRRPEVEFKSDTGEWHFGTLLFVEEKTGKSTYPFFVVDDSSFYFVSECRMRKDSQ